MIKDIGTEGIKVDKRPKTLIEECTDLREAVIELGDHIAKALHLQQIYDWLNGKLKRIIR